MAMIVGIRPDGFVYLPLLLSLLFVVSIKKIPLLSKSNLLGSLIILIPSAITYFSWQIYIGINNFSVNADPLIGVLNLESWLNLIPSTSIAMFGLIFKEWNTSGFLFLCIILCIILGIKSYKNLSTKEKPFLLLLSIPIYKFIVLIFENSLNIATQASTSIRLSRHIMQTAPIVYFLLGFLLIKWFSKKFGARINILSKRIRGLLFLFLFSTIFILQLMIGSVFAHLPSEINNYIERWTNIIRKDCPDCKNVLLILPKNATIVPPLWSYYALATPAIYAPASYEFKLISKSYPDFLEYLNKNKVDALFVYAPDNQVEEQLKIDIAEDMDYLLLFKNNTMTIVHSEKRPYVNKMGTQWRTRAIRSFFNDLKFWQ